MIEHGEHYHPAQSPIWDRLEIKAPPNFEPVYHVTASEYLPDIDQHGLIAQPEKRNPAVEQLLDEAMSDGLRQAGVSRDCVFASPDPQANTFASQTLYREKANTVLELAVDADRSFVFDSNLVGEAHAALSRGNRERALEIAREYWNGGITLREYFDHGYESKDGYCQPSDDAENMPWYYQPEVLAPGNVPQKYIRVFTQRIPGTSK